MADNNKPMMYMRYAIGEIVLVVIGILIALQINTWNESRKEKNKAKIYTNKLINDIVQDTLNINELINTGHEKTANINAYFKFFSEGDQTIDAYIDSVTKVNWTFFRYQPLNYTFEDMKSSGNLALLTEAQRRSMMELLNLQEQLRIIIEKTVTGTIDYNYEGNKYLDLSDNDYDFYEVLGTDLSKKEKEKGLLARHQAFEQLLSLYFYMDSFGRQIKEKSKMTIELLEAD